MQQWHSATILSSSATVEAFKVGPSCHADIRLPLSFFPHLRFWNCSVGQNTSCLNKTLQKTKLQSHTSQWLSVDSHSVRERPGYYSSGAGRSPDGATEPRDLIWGLVSYGLMSGDGWLVNAMRAEVLSGTYYILGLYICKEFPSGLIKFYLILSLTGSEQYGCIMAAPVWVLSAHNNTTSNNRKT